MCDERLVIFLNRSCRSASVAWTQPKPIKNGLPGSDDRLRELNGDEASAGWASSP
jgi:hypothetical protein